VDTWRWVGAGEDDICIANVAKQHLIPAYCVWSAWLWLGEANIPFAEIDINMGRHGSRRDAFLQSVFPTCLSFYENVWIASHHVYCTERCATAQAWDGNMKLYCSACPVFLDSSDQVAPLHCQNAVRHGSICCAVHQDREAAFASAAARRASNRALRNNGARAADSCLTLKEKHTRSVHRSCGIFGGRFLDCGTFGLMQKFFVSESREMVTAAIARHAALQPRLALFLYDDVCHLFEWWRAQAVQNEHCLAAKLLQLRGYLNRSHQRGHRRWQCHTQYAADIDDELDDLKVYKCYTAEDVDLVLRTAPGTRLHPTSVRSWSNLTEGPVGPEHRADPVAKALHALWCHSLPLSVRFLTPANPIIRDFNVHTEERRQEVLAALAGDKVGGRVTSDTKIGRALLKSGSKLFHVKSGDLVLAQCYSVEYVRRTLKENTSFPVLVTTGRKRNGEVCEHGWRRLNKHRHNLRYVTPALFDYLLLRTCHLHNSRLWKGIPAPFPTEH
jgi:hypothetical protein